MQEDRDVIISVQNLSKSYSTLAVLKDINLDVKKGEVIAIIGPSGSGKSTMLRCLNALETISGGEIYYKGEPISKMKKYTSLREEVGMVFQHFNLFPHMTVLENIVYAPIKVKKRAKDTIRMEAMNLLETVGLEEKKDVYPEMLSGGQKQRVAIARALAMQPEVLLFDEPTEGLDPVQKRAFYKMLKKLSKNHYIIISTHLMEDVEAIADRVVMIDSGALIHDVSLEKFKAISKTNLMDSFNLAVKE